MYGYAMALLARDRQEEAPSWARYLRPDPKSLLKKSQRWLKAK